jgi:hypothetical protein
MSFELMLPLFDPNQPSLLEDSLRPIAGSPDVSCAYERDRRLQREPSIRFDAGKLRTGLEMIVNQLDKRLGERRPCRRVRCHMLAFHRYDCVPKRFRRKPVSEVQHAAA